MLNIAGNELVMGRTRICGAVLPELTPQYAPRQTPASQSNILVSACSALLTIAAPTLSLRRVRRALVKRVVAVYATPRPDPESLRWALELAVRSEDYQEAAYLRNAIPEADIERPVVALSGLVRERVRRNVFLGLDQSAVTESRVTAVRQLRDLATAPAAFAEAENGLHAILRDSKDDVVAQAAEAALWAAWLASGDEVIDTTMKNGIAWMGARQLTKALQAFTEVVNAAPTYAEGWNKRATALFLATRFDESIEDCQRVLNLKPHHFGCLSGLGICYLRKGNEKEAARCLRKALEVNPRSTDMQRIVADLEARLVFSVLRPRIAQVFKEMRGDILGNFSGSADPARPAHVCTNWDAHRVTDAGRCTYFFRVTIACLEGPPVVGTARYYAMKYMDGSVFPLTRVTQGPAGFKLEPGQTYSYSFMLTVRAELTAARGGFLVRRGDVLFEAELDQLPLNRIPSTTEIDIPRMNKGYQFMGRLEIQCED